MTKKKYALITTLITTMCMSGIISVMGQASSHWNVSVGDEYRWTVTDEYYDITAEDATINADQQVMDVDPITYNISHWNASQGATPDDHTSFPGAREPWSNREFYLDIQSNAHKIQIWGYVDNLELPKSIDEKMYLLETIDGGDNSTFHMDRPTYDPDSYPDGVYPTANYTIVFLSRYEADYLDDWTDEMILQEEVLSDYYNDYLGSGKMFKFGKMVNFSIQIRNDTQHDTKLISGSSDSTDYSITYDRYAHTDESLDLGIDTTSIRATNVRIGVIYSDLIALDQVLFLTDESITAGNMQFSMKSDLASMDNGITVSLDRIYQGPAARLVTVYVVIYNNTEQDWADPIDQTKNPSGNPSYPDRILPETNTTLLGFYTYQARFLEGKYTTKLNTKYTINHLDLNIKGLADTAMDSDNIDDIKYTGELVLEGDAPVEVSIPNYLDISIIAPLLGSVGSLPPEAYSHGIYVPSAINYIYSSPVDHIEGIVNELRWALGNNTTPNIDFFAVGEVLSTISFAHLMIVPNNFQYESLKSLINDTIDMLLESFNDTTSEYDYNAFISFFDYFNIDANDNSQAMNVSVHKNIMPYFYDTHKGPTQLGMDARWSGGFFQETKITIYHPQISQLRIIRIQKVPKATLLETFIAWIMFFLSLLGVGIALVVVRKKIKSKKNCSCNPSDSDCNCDL